MDLGAVTETVEIEWFVLPAYPYLVDDTVIGSPALVLATTAGAAMVLLGRRETARPQRQGIAS